MYLTKVQFSSVENKIENKLFKVIRESNLQINLPDKHPVAAKRLRFHLARSYLRALCQLMELIRYAARIRVHQIIPTNLL